MIQMSWPQYLRHECTIDGRRARFGHGSERFELLALLLISSPERFVSPAELIEASWPNPDFEPEYARAIISRSIYLLRARGVSIETNYGFGYRIPRWAREQVQMAEAA